MALTLKEFIHRLNEKKHSAPNWARPKGVYADLSKYPDIQYYLKCPKCGQVHGSYKTMREAHGKRLCDLCNIEAIEKHKKMIKDVDSYKNRGKPGKGLSKVYNEAQELLPDPEEFNPREYLLNTPADDWIRMAMFELGVQEGTEFVLARRSQDADPDSDTQVDVEGDDGTEWRIYKSEDEAHTAALNDVQERLRDEPSSFSQDWLKGHINLERLKEYLSDEARNIDWITDQSEEEQVEHLDREGILSKDDFYDAEGNFVVDGNKLEDGLDLLRDRKAESFDPMEWMEEVYGKEEAAAKAIELVGIDVEAAAQEAIQTDGWIHFMPSYDGNYTELRDSDAVAFRVN